jgi:superfamily II DNA or RNA helicase
MSFIRSFVSEEVDRDSLEKGQDLLTKSGSVYQIIYDAAQGVAYYRVRGGNSPQWFEVRVSGLTKEGQIKQKCNCQEFKPVCQHAVAALLHLDREMTAHAEANSDSTVQVVSDSGESEIEMDSIELTTVMLNTSSTDWPLVKMIATDKRVIVLQAVDYQVHASLDFRSEKHSIYLRHNDGGSFTTRCSCKERRNRLCVHKAAVFMQLLNERGEHYFEYLRDWTEEKDRLLSEYGFSTKDPLDSLFEFYFGNGSIKLKVLAPTLRKLAAFDSYDDLQIAGTTTGADDSFSIPSRQVQVKSGQDRYGILFNLQVGQPYPGFSLSLFSARFDGSSSLPVSHLTIYDTGNRQSSRPGMYLNYDVLTAAQSMGSETFRNLFGARVALSSDTEQPINDYLKRKLPLVFEALLDEPDLFLHQDEVPILRSLVRTRVAPERLEVSLRLEVENVLARLRPVFTLDGHELPWEDCQFVGPYIVRYGETLYLLQNLHLGDHLTIFKNGPIIVHESAVKDFHRVVVMPLQKLFKVEVPEEVEMPTRYMPMVCALYLEEQDPYLFVKPIFQYGEFKATKDGLNELITLENDQPLVVLRDPDAEEAFWSLVENAHPTWKGQGQSGFFTIHAKDLMQDLWLRHFLQTMQESSILLHGYEGLKKFKINTSKPETQMRVSTGLDWFDVKMEVRFGDQMVSVQELHKAIMARRNYIELPDGSLGLLPQEWLDRYGLILTIADKKGGTIKVPKLYFNLIDDLHDQIDDVETLKELQAKKERIRAFEQVKEVALPANLKADLRPYQKDGFRWLKFLDEYGWGGILADDMGLGKTVQALTFVQSLLNERPDAKVMIICPMSLIYNWENEIKKFAPDIKYIIHHGPMRRRVKEELTEPQVVISSYGTVRSDIDTFRTILYDYIVLDESQAIKNPLSLSSKAVNLLKAKNRLCLSGTPLQNNSFDLYAQLNFCNPGMLGSMEFFREHFSMPIDKLQDPDAAARLRKLTSPFILRRVKEEVAADLPARIDSIIYCEMGKEQRMIYEQVRLDVRAQLLDRIDRDGIVKSGVFILQALIKLRQICDSPILVNDGVAYPPHSVKLEELSREIAENVSNHKVLIFSQFLGMLDLIKRKLNDLKVPHAYFDGKMNREQRQEAVDLFQGDPNTRIFLISLKAGGVGLNLTAADYVYIVDPWWNPAVEQQAIDRTHRIGQEKTVFAYRMICKDTIEEKIMDLQQRKKEIAEQLVSGDALNLNKLTREDIVFLLS